MSKFNARDLWDEIYGKALEAYDYAGRRMVKAACGDPNSRYEPTIDHIRPLSKGGKDNRHNIVICSRETNKEKADSFPYWKANGRSFTVRLMNNWNDDYEIVDVQGGIQNVFQMQGLLWQD